jgi:hypothetical protein
VLSFLFKDHHEFNFEIGVFELLLRSDYVAYLVLMENATNAGGSIWVAVDRDEPIEVCHHQ